MKIAAPTITPGALLVGVGVLVGGILLVRASTAAAKLAGQAYEGAKDAAWAVTPWNNENVVNEWVNDLLFGTDARTIGGTLYDLMSGVDLVTKEQAEAVVKATNQAPVTYDWSKSTPGATSAPTFTISPGL